MTETKTTKQTRFNDPMGSPKPAAPAVPVAPRSEPKPQEGPKSFTQTFTAGVEVLRLIATRIKAGWRVEAVHSPKPKTNVRGASSTHPTVEAARAQVATLAATAVKEGWTKREPKTVGLRREDAFSTIPKPGKPSNKK